MSVLALETLYDMDLLDLNDAPKIKSYKNMSSIELRKIVTQYAERRSNDFSNEFYNHNKSKKLSAQYSTLSAKVDRKKILNSLLFYNFIVINDPFSDLINTDDINFDQFKKALCFISWMARLIRNGLIFLYPLTVRKSNRTGLLITDDNFRSSFTENIHSFIHDRAILKSVVGNADFKKFIVLNENASINKRSAINVSFKNDTIYRGVSLFLHHKIIKESIKKNNDGSFTVSNYWNPKEILDRSTFEKWAYAVVNQAIIARLNDIHLQVHIANNIGATYITESNFESDLMGFSNITSGSIESDAVRFLEVNNRKIEIDSPNNIIKFRNKFSSSFNGFNEQLVDISDYLSKVEPDRFDLESKNILNNDINPQVIEIDKTIRSLNSYKIASPLLLTGTIGLAVITSSPALPMIPAIFFGALNLVGGTNVIKDYKDLKYWKSKPAYIWHNILKK